MKVRATAEYVKRNLKDLELNYIPREGEEFEVSEERYRILNGKNPFKAKFVEKVEEQRIEQEDVKKVDAILNPKNNFKKRNK